MAMPSGITTISPVLVCRLAASVQLAIGLELVLCRISASDSIRRASCRQRIGESRLLVLLLGEGIMITLAPCLVLSQHPRNSS